MLIHFMVLFFSALTVFNISNPRHVGHKSVITSVSFSPDGQTVLSGNMDGMLLLWSIRNGQKIHALHAHQGGVTSVAFLPDGKKAITGGNDGKVKLWDLNSGKKLVDFIGRGGATERVLPILCVAISPNGKLAAAGGIDEGIKIWEIDSGNLIHTLPGHAGPVKSITFSPDSTTLLSAGGDATHNGSFIVWDVVTGNKVRRVFDDTYIKFAAFMPKENRILTGGGRALKVWNADRGELIYILNQEAYVDCVAISPDTKLVVTSGSSGVITAWDISQGKLIRTLTGHTNSVNSLSFDPTGKTLLSGSADMTIKIWNAFTGNLIRSFPAKEKNNSIV
jgi:WD40 repeat protein